MEIDARVYEASKTRSYPLLFATISGSHLYGFNSPNSDIDLRGSHILPLEDVIGLNSLKDTIESSSDRYGFDCDFVTHDVAKFFTMMLKKNGYVLEQIVSPLVIASSPAFEELRSLVPLCLTKYHSYHYLGFAEQEWKVFLKTPTVKSLLYVYRVLLCGTYLMQTKQLEPNLVKLNEHFNIPGLSDLISRKASGLEKGEMEFSESHLWDYERLLVGLKEARDKTSLPEMGTAKEPLNDLLIRIRLGKV